MKILRSLTTVGGFTIGSRIFGFVRDVVMAYLLGPGPIMDALVISIKLPSLFRRLLAEGAFNAVFVPMFASIYTAEGKQAARTFAEEILSVFIIVLLGVVCFAEIVMPWVVPFFVPGFKATPERLNATIEFSRILFPFIFFISLTALYSGILNSFDRFTAAASSPMAGNIFIVGCALGINSLVHQPGPVLAWSVLGCGMIQLLWVWIPCWKMGIPLSFHTPKLTTHVKTLLKRAAPVALGSGVHQINILVGIFIASLLDVGDISYLYCAERLNQLPLSTVGTAMSIVLIPTLAKAIRASELQKVHFYQAQAIELALLLVVPAAIGLICLAHPLVKVLFEHGEFSAESSLMTARALQAFSIGLPAYVLAKVFSSNFYAQGDTTTPLIAGCASVATDITLSISFLSLKPFGAAFDHVGIALATAIAAWVNVLTLGYCLYEQGLLKIDLRLKKFLGTLLFSGSVTVASLLVLTPLILPWIEGGMLQKLLAAGLLVFTGLVTFISFASLTGALKWQELRLQFQSEA